MPISLKLPAELKKRIEPLARGAGKTPHAWMVAALEEQVTRAELREKFIQDALDSAKNADVGGPLYAAEDVHAYMRARAARGNPPKPKPLKRRRR